jgi:hypothetical protein
MDTVSLLFSLSVLRIQSSVLGGTYKLRDLENPSKAVSRTGESFVRPPLPTTAT